MFFLLIVFFSMIFFIFFISEFIFLFNVSFLVSCSRSFNGRGMVFSFLIFGVLFFLFKILFECECVNFCGLIEW